MTDDYMICPLAGRYWGVMARTADGWMLVSRHPSKRAAGIERNRLAGA